MVGANSTFKWKVLSPIPQYEIFGGEGRLIGGWQTMPIREKIEFFSEKGGGNVWVGMQT